uniref:Uncharacterized protein n=1 Tax=Anguilla anguilla TaxID=7936 RepID=A0A0E9VIX6_ANGAN
MCVLLCLCLSQNACYQLKRLFGDEGGGSSSLLNPSSPLKPFVLSCFFFSASINENISLYRKNVLQLL